MRAPNVTTVRLAVLALLAALAPAALALSTASAAVGDPSVVQCISGHDIPGCTTSAPDFNGGDLAVSPDGKQLYAVSWLDGSIRIFDRSADNRLTPRQGPTGCYNGTGAGGCTAVFGLGTFTYDFALSADGLSAYVAGNSDIVALRRDPATGNLATA